MIEIKKKSIDAYIVALNRSPETLLSSTTFFFLGILGSCEISLTARSIMLIFIASIPRGAREKRTIHFFSLVNLEELTSDDIEFTGISNKKFSLPHVTVY
jgi:hypothetical protein